jgi:hypothetical protein
LLRGRGLAAQIKNSCQKGKNLAKKLKGFAKKRWFI